MSKIEKETLRPKIDFDVFITEPKFMPKVAKVAKVAEVAEMLEITPASSPHFQSFIHLMFGVSIYSLPFNLQANYRTEMNSPMMRNSFSSSIWSITIGSYS